MVDMAEAFINRALDATQRLLLEASCKVCTLWHWYKTHDVCVLFHIIETSGTRLTRLQG